MTFVTWINMVYRSYTYKIVEPVTVGRDGVCSRSGTGSPVQVEVSEARATFPCRFFSAHAEFFLFHFLVFTFFLFSSLLHPTRCEWESASALHAFNSPSGPERPCRSAEQVSYCNSFFSSRLFCFLFSPFFMMRLSPLLQNRCS